MTLRAHIWRSEAVGGTCWRNTAHPVEMDEQAGRRQLGSKTSLRILNNHLSGHLDHYIQAHHLLADHIMVHTGRHNPH
jgi:hypothetical protein